MSAGIRFDLRELNQVNRRLGELRRLDKHSLMEAVGFTVENQVRDRIRNDKTTPEGEPWPAWSPNYAKTRNEGQSLLEGHGDLLQSMTYEVDGDGTAVEIGSPLVYAAIQNFGGKSDMAPGPAGIPAREYLGLSEDNKSELESVVTHWLDEQIHGAQA